MNMRFFTCFGFLMSLLLCSVCRADDVAEVRAAVDDLYVKLSARDIAGVAAYLPQSGFTEFNADSAELQTFDRAYFEGAFRAGVRINLRVTGLQAKLFHDVCVATGYRVGSIVLPDGTKQEGKQCLSMVWSREGSAWKLEHVHLSKSVGQ